MGTTAVWDALRCLLIVEASVFIGASLWYCRHANYRSGNLLLVSMLLLSSASIDNAVIHMHQDFAWPLPLQLVAYVFALAALRMWRIERGMMVADPVDRPWWRR